MKALMKVLGPIVLASALGTPVAARELVAIFDKPISQKIISLPPDKVNPHGAGTLSCFYYNGFMVKEIDTKQKYADKLSITPVVSGQKPPCKRDDPNEIVLKDWYGFFAGVKGRYAVFWAGDGVNRAMGYAVFDRETGTRQFVLDVEANNDGPPYSKNIHSLSVTGDTLTVLYRRVYVAGCSLYEGKTDCWNSVKKELTLMRDTPAPDCRNLYEQEQQNAPQLAEETLKLPTVIGYEAKLTYNSGKAVITSERGPISCWMVD